MIVPALVKHSQAIYDLLESKSTKEKLDGRNLPVFRGKLYETFRESGVSQGYYTPIFRALEDGHYITIVQRGNRSVDSVVVLFERPTDEMDLTGASRPARVSPDELEGIRQEVSQIRQSLGGLNIVEALDNLERRLTKLENKQKVKDRKAKTGGN